MKNKIWILFTILLIGIMLILSGCDDKKSNSSLLSEIPSVLIEENKMDDKRQDEAQEESNIDSQEVQEQPKNNKEQKAQNLEVNKTQINIAPTSHAKKEKPHIETKAIKDSKDAERKKSTATISIVGPEDVGVILKTIKVEIDKDDRVIDVLEKVTAQKNIHLDYKGSGMTAYVRGIHNIYEFDRGVKSGWKYQVNGIILGEGAGTYMIKDGDRIEWFYTID